MSYILVVDDDASHRVLLCDLLREMGYQTQEATNGREALDQLDGSLPHAVLLDLRMPVMSGWGVLQGLKEMPHAKDVPIIIISAYRFEREAAIVCAGGHISTPFDL